MTGKEFTDAATRLRQIAMARARAFPLGGADVEDIAQDTLLKLWALREGIPSADRACRLSAVIARHLAIDLLRAHHTVPLAEMAGDKEPRHGTSPPLPMTDKPLIAISDSALQEAYRMADIELARMEAQQDEGLRQYEVALSEVYDIMAGMYAEEESADDDNAQDYDKSF